MRPVLTLALIILTACSRAQSREPVTQHLIIMGDSIAANSMDLDTMTYGDYKSTVAAQLVQQYNLRVTNLSAPGQTMAWAWNSRIDNAVRFLTFWPYNAAVWIQLGHNDWSLSRTPEQFKTDYSNMLYGLWLTNTQVFCALPIRSVSDSQHHTNEHGKTLEDYRQIIIDIVDEAPHACTLVDTRNWFTDAEVFGGIDLPDGLHPSSAGHQVYLENLAQIINLEEAE